MIVLIVLLSLSVILLCMASIDKHIIPTLTPDNKFRKWWTKHIIDEDPYDL